MRPLQLVGGPVPSPCRLNDENSRVKVQNVRRDSTDDVPRGNPKGLEVKMTAMERITGSADVCGSRPCIRGLRIRVKDVLELLAAGTTTEEILADYPNPRDGQPSLP